MNFVLETNVQCPWCGEVFPTTVDTSTGDYSAVEDCNVCCRPIEIAVSCEPGEILSLDAARG